jgi:hypothetical protein
VLSLPAQRIRVIQLLCTVWFDPNLIDAKYIQKLGARTGYTGALRGPQAVADDTKVKIVVGQQQLDYGSIRQAAVKQFDEGKGATVADSTPLDPNERDSQFQKLKQQILAAHEQRRLREKKSKQQKRVKKATKKSAKKKPTKKEAKQHPPAKKRQKTAHGLAHKKEHEKTSDSDSDASTASESESDDPQQRPTGGSASSGPQWRFIQSTELKQNPTHASPKAGDLLVLRGEEQLGDTKPFHVARLSADEAHLLYLDTKDPWNFFTKYFPCWRSGTKEYAAANPRKPADRRAKGEFVDANDLIAWGFELVDAANPDTGMLPPALAAQLRTLIGLKRP